MKMLLGKGPCTQILNNLTNQVSFLECQTQLLVGPLCIPNKLHMLLQILHSHNHCFVVEQVRQLTFQSAEFQHLISLAEFFGIPAINLRSSYEASSHQTS